ncbi:MAG TPA: heparinase, partial [Phenylobacterium sp.]|nr:heparinase [Phenylobacterium sp.]
MTRLPGGTYALALALGTRRVVAREWAGSPMHRWMLVSPRPEGLAITPRDPRPADPLAGRKILAGKF